MSKVLNNLATVDSRLTLFPSECHITSPYLSDPSCYTLNLLLPRTLVFPISNFAFAKSPILLLSGWKMREILIKSFFVLCSTRQINEISSFLFPNNSFLFDKKIFEETEYFLFFCII